LVAAAFSPSRVALLGASGSIGMSTIAVLRQHPARFRLVAVAAQTNWRALLAIIEEFRPDYCAVESADAAAQLRDALGAGAARITIESGKAAVTAVAALDSVDTVVAGISGFAGLASTWAAVAAGKRVLLANKEALVASGNLLLAEARRSGARVLPVDSEHNAVYQCANGMHCDVAQVRAITLTASGGPFRLRPLDSFANIQPDEACKHPTWDMGRKISVDSATLMNKGLEVIEASLLFQRPGSDIEVLIHPSSTVHAMVEYVDGSILAHLGPADMQVPIAHALGLPERLPLAVERLSLARLGKLEFFAVDERRFPALRLAYDALAAGQGSCLALNAANEVAVHAFLRGQIAYTEIVATVQRTLDRCDRSDPASMDEVFAQDDAVRRVATAMLSGVAV